VVTSVVGAEIEVWAGGGLAGSACEGGSRVDLDFFFDLPYGRFSFADLDTTGPTYHRYRYVQDSVETGC